MTPPIVTLAQSGPGSLSTSAHVFIAVATLVLVLFIGRLLRRHQIRSKYALVWMGAAIVLGALAIVPGVLDRVSDWVGIDYGPALFLLLAVGFLLLVVIDFSREVTRLDARTRTLAEEVAFLRAALEEDGDGGPAHRAEPPAGPKYDRPSPASQEPR
jgi:hypothetical protein